MAPETTCMGWMRQAPHGDGAATAPAGREQGGLPAEKPFLGEGQAGSAELSPG